MDTEFGSTKSLVDLFREASTEIQMEKGETIDDPSAKCVEIKTKDGETKQVSGLEFWEQMIREVEEQKKDPNYLFAPPADQIISETFTSVLENPTSDEAPVCWKGVYYTPRPSSSYLQNLDLGIEQRYLTQDVRPPRKVIKILRRKQNVPGSSSDDDITEIMELIDNMESSSADDSGNLSPNRCIDLTQSSLSNGSDNTGEGRNINLTSNDSDDEITKMMERIHGMESSTPSCSGDSSSCINLTIPPIENTNISTKERNIELTVVDNDASSSEDDITKMMERIHGMECSSPTPSGHLHSSSCIDLTRSPYGQNNTLGEGRTIDLTTSENGVLPTNEWYSRNMNTPLMDDDLLKILVDDYSKNMTTHPNWESPTINTMITHDDSQQRNINIATNAFQYMQMANRGRRQIANQHGRFGIRRQLYNPYYGYRLQKYFGQPSSALQQIVPPPAHLSTTSLNLRSSHRAPQTLSYPLSKLLAPYRAVPWDFQLLPPNQASSVPPMYTQMSHVQRPAVYRIPTADKQLPNSAHAYIKAQNPWIPKPKPIGMNTAVWQYFPAANNQTAHEKWRFKVPLAPRHPHINNIRAHKASYVPYYRPKNQTTFCQK